VKSIKLRSAFLNGASGVKSLYLALSYALRRLTQKIGNGKGSQIILQYWLKLNRVIFLIVSLFLVFSVLAAEKGKLYLVLGSDTSFNPYGGLNYYDGRLWQALLYADPAHNAYTVMDTSFRNQYRDSYGTPVKMTWWMMAGNIFHLSKNCNVPIRNNISLYLMKKYHGAVIELCGDQLSLHYHNYLWSDTNGDGVFCYNQGMDFNLSEYDYEQTLCKYLIEDDVFPVSFRSGWHYMDNAWQAYQERFIPFDMSNAYPAIGGDVNEPSWYIDWSQSPAAFVPYHPNADDYQIEGNLKQWRLRSTQFQDYNTMRANLETMFREAANGNDQMGCFWGHLAEEASFLNGLNNLNALAHQFSEQYGVDFRYCQDVEAMRLWINPADTIAPALTVHEIEEDENIRFAIETDGPVFQVEEPFIAVKTKHETFERLSCIQTGVNRWETLKALPAEILAKVSVAVCDSVGNQAKVHLDYVPDDIFIDDQHPEFREISGSWGNYTSGELWDLNARILNGLGSVTITPEIPESRAYRISFHGPGSTSNSVRCIMQHASVVDTVLFDSTLLGTNYWQEIGIFDLEGSTENALTIENLAAGKKLGLDVIHFSPLVPGKYLIVDRDSLNFGDVTIEDSTTRYITIGNMGSGALNVTMAHSGGKLTIKTDIPMVLAPGETRKIPIAFVSQEYGEYRDVITIESDDPLNSDIRIPVYANATSYFKLVDNDDPSGYREFGDTWFTSIATAYGSSSRCAWIRGNGLHADFTMTLKYTDTYDIQFIVPATENAHNHADYIILVNGTAIDTVVVDQNLGSGQFVSIGTYDLPEGVPVCLRIQDNGGNTNTNPSIVLRADAVRFVRVKENLSAIHEAGIPDEFVVHQNYPNPFNPLTTIRFSLPKQQRVTLNIYDLNGHLIKTLIHEEVPPGNYSIPWNATDNSDNPV